MPTDSAEPRSFVAALGHPSAWLVVPTAALLSGQAAAASPFELPVRLGAFLVIPFLLVVPRRSRPWAFLMLMAGLAFALGYVRHRQLLYPQLPPHHLRSLADGSTRLYLEGTLAQEPEKLPNRHRWLLRSERIWHATGAQEATGDVLISVRAARREWRYGDRIRLWIRPGIPRDSGNPGGFNYEAYLARREIYTVGFLENDGEVELLARSPGSILSAVEALRRAIRRQIDERFHPENGALLKALVVGDMGGISNEMRRDFTAAGVNHVLSISGLHVAMLGLVIFYLVRATVGRSTYLLLRYNMIKVASLLSFAGVVFYTAVAGAMVPTVRSAIMIGVYEFAVLLDREEEVFTSLTLAALLIALVWPGVIADISFQLSFVAVLSIVAGARRWLSRPQLRAREELPQERSWLRDKLRGASLQFVIPLLATVGTGPLIAHYFGHLSLSGFISNPLVVPLVGFLVVPLGLLVGFLFLIAPALALPMITAGDWLLSLTRWLVGCFANLPLASIAVPSPDLFEVAALYLLILTLLTFRKHRAGAVAFAAVLLLLAFDGYYWWQERWNRKELRVTHLNVGQGDAAVVEFPGAKVLLIDAGGSAFNDFDSGERIIAPFLRSRKILKVDYLLLSHPRIDHYGGMRTIVEQFAPSEFWSGTGGARTARFEDLQAELDKARVQRVTLSDQQGCRELHGTRLCVVHSPLDASDDGSVAVQLQFGKIRLLFAGDLQKKEELLLLQKSRTLASAVLKVPRHGSAVSSAPEFIAAVRPKLAVVSAAGHQGLPRKEVLERYRSAGAEILRTDQDGAIVVETNGDGVRYRAYKSGKQGALTF